MDYLPIEILSSVCQQLQRWTLSEQPFAHLTETSIYGTDGWLTHTTESCKDICNFRLSCRKAYHSSFGTFGELLGSRIFRITQVGLEDLLSISRLEPIRPYVRTLTFGNARFGSATSYSLLEEALETMSHFDRQRLKIAYSNACRWGSVENGKLHIEMLACAFMGLSFVKNVRFLISDHPRHLGGWLGPKDNALIAKALADISDIWLADDSLYEMNTGNGRLYEPVLAAMKTSGSTIEDVRIGHGYAVAPSCLSDMLQVTGTPSNLRRVRLEIDPQYLCFDPHLPPTGIYWDAFGMLGNVTHLSLAMNRDAAFSDFALATTNLFRLLEPIHHLQQLTVRGVWTYTEKDLVEFAATRKDQLRQFVLMGPVLLDSTWSQALCKFMSHLTSHTKHVQFTGISKRESNTRIIPALNRLAWNTFLQDIRPLVDNAPYSVCLSSDHRRYIHQPMSR